MEGETLIPRPIVRRPLSNKQRLRPQAGETRRRETPTARASSGRPSPGFGLAVLVAAAVLFAGCAVGPDYARPTTPRQERWKERASSNAVVTLPAEWWQVFEDPDLDALETQAVAANQDLQRAVARVTEARAVARVSEAELYLNLSGNSAYTRYRSSGSQARVPGQKLEDDSFSTSFDLDYELDIWGRVRRSVEASRADARAAAADLQVVLLTLTADVARNYYLIRSLDAEKVVVEATLALRRDAVQLQETRREAGLINEVDVTRARTESANVEAELHALTRARAQVEHALAVLCGQAPGAFSVAARNSAVPVPHIPVGLPSSLLERRPDVIGAERRLAADSARIGVAKAAFFPRIKLTGAAGLASADLGTLVDWPSRFWSIGPSIHVPIFEGGRNRANLAVAEAHYEQSVAAYRGSILVAFREVEDSLSDLGTLAAQGDAVNRALNSARDTANLANERYQKGLSSYLDVVDAQRAALQAERQETQLRGQRAIATILLAKALGGGWEAEASGASAGRPLAAIDR